MAHRTIAATDDDLNEAWHSQCRLHPHVEPNVILQVLLDGHTSYAAWREEQLARDHWSFMLSEVRYKARRAQIEAEHERAKRFNKRSLSRTPPRRGLNRRVGLKSNVVANSHREFGASTVV